MPLWRELGGSLAADVPGYVYENDPLDAASAFEQAYSRSRLVDRLAELLHDSDATPGNAHRAFCALRFDRVLTTNFDLLLERAYNAADRWGCVPMVDESHLTMRDRPSMTHLVKFHGDLNHPERLVVTERDFDLFLSTKPLMAAWLTGMLLQRTLVLIGYSLADPDLRHVFSIVDSRLGGLRREAYALVVDCTDTERLRFGRRGVTVVELRSRGHDFDAALAEVFVELGRVWRESVATTATAADERPLELIRAGTPQSWERVCFFAVPQALVSFYKEAVFPAVREELQLEPTTAADIVTAPGSELTKVQALIDMAGTVVVDLAGPTGERALSAASASPLEKALVVVVESGAAVPPHARSELVVERPREALEEPESFVHRLVGAVAEARGLVRETSPAPAHDDPLAQADVLFSQRHYGQALVAAYAQVEAALSSPHLAPPGRRPSFVNRLREAAGRGFVPPGAADVLIDSWGARNGVVHGFGDPPGRVRTGRVIAAARAITSALRGS